MSDTELPMEPENDAPTWEQLSEISTLRERTAALIECMDLLLERGEAADNRLTAHYEETGFRPGLGSRVLLGNTMPPEDRFVFSRLLLEYENMEQTIRNLSERSAESSPVAASTRAVGSRYRI